jgi:hypothetical protein
MLGMGAAPAEVATQLARSAEPGDREAIDALRQAAHSVGHSDASAAADLSKRALELLAADDAEHGSLVAETVGLLNRASRYQEAEELAVAVLSEVASPQEEAEIRLHLATLHKHTTQRRVEENRRALQLVNISDVTQELPLLLVAVSGHHDTRDKFGVAADAGLGVGRHGAWSCRTDRRQGIVKLLTWCGAARIGRLWRLRRGTRATGIRSRSSGTRCGCITVSR